MRKRAFAPRIDLSKGAAEVAEQDNANGKFAQEAAVGSMSCLIARLLCLLCLCTLWGDSADLAKGANPWVWRLCAEGHCAIYLLACLHCLKTII